MRSLKNELTVQVGNYLATRRGNAFSIVGCAPVTKDRRFTLVLMKKGRFRLSGKNSSGERLRNWIKALGVDEAIAEAEALLFGSKSDLVIPDLSISTVCTLWLEEQSCSKESLRHYRQYLGYFMAWLDDRGLVQFTDIRAEHLQRYAKETVERGLKPKTIKHYCCPVRAVARWASRNWGQVRDFSVGFRLPTRKREIKYREKEHQPFLPLVESLDFLDWLSQQDNGWRILAGVALQVLGGLRVREALRLTWAKVDFERGTIIVDGIVKNIHSVRRIPIPEVALAILSQAPRYSERVVYRYDDSHPYGKAVTRALKRWQPGLQLEPEGFRRTIPTEATARGWNRFALERFIGHSPEGITERHYIGGSVESMENLLQKEVVQKVNEILACRLEEWQQNGKKATGLFDRKSSETNVLQLPFLA
jgi:integrase